MKKRVYTYAVVIYSTDKLVALNTSINPDYDNSKHYPFVKTLHTSFALAEKECRKRAKEIYRYGGGNYFYAIVEPLNDRVRKLPRTDH